MVSEAPPALFTGLGVRDRKAGRYSEWEYYNSDHAFLAGRKAAERVRELAREKAPESLVETAGPGTLGLPAAGL